MFLCCLTYYHYFLTHSRPMLFLHTSWKYKQLFFWYFRGTYKRNTGLKWVKEQIILSLIFTAWNVSVFRVFMVRVFLHSDSVCLHIQAKCGKIQTRKNLNANAFHAVSLRISCIFFYFLQRKSYVIISFY